MEDFGWLSLLPTLVVVGVALVTRKTFDALVAGSIVGALFLYKFSFLGGFADVVLSQMQDPTIGWVMLVCGLFGSLIQLLVKTGGAFAFAQTILRYVHNRKSALLVTWVLGIVIFIDDYLNALTVGNSMKKVTDKFKVPREMLAYVVDSTAAPICVLIPLSTWAIYVAGLLESIELVPAGEGLSAYLGAIPFIAYGWVAASLVPLVILGVIPAIGPMKQAEERVKLGGTLKPPHSENMGKEIVRFPDIHPTVGDFALPILVLIGATIFFEIDALKGIITAVIFTVLYQALVRRQITYTIAIQEVFAGFKSMIYALAIILMSFVLKEVNDQMGLTQWVIEGVTPIINKAWLPAILFITLSGVTFATGSFWGVYAITLPIVVPLAQSLDVNIWLAIGSVLSAGVFGSHTCFYGDATVLSSSASGCNNMAHALSQLPYALLGGALTTLIYILLGFTF